MRFNTANHMCEDIDECEELGPDVCLNGICIDTLGSYECECSPGYILDHTGHICMGMNNQIYTNILCLNITMSKRFSI